MILRIGNHALKIPITTLILLIVSAIFLLTGLAVYGRPEYEELIMGFVIPGAIIGAIGVVFLISHVRDRV